MEFLILKWDWGLKVHPLWLLSIPTQDGPAGSSGHPWSLSSPHQEAYPHDETVPQQVSYLSSAWSWWVCLGWGGSGAYLSLTGRGAVQNLPMMVVWSFFQTRWEA